MADGDVHKADTAYRETKGVATIYVKQYGCMAVIGEQHNLEKST